MLNRTQIEKCAQKAGIVAYKVLDLDCKYSIVLIDDPAVSEDARLDTTKYEIQINLAQLQPFPVEIAGVGEENLTEENKQSDEDFRHILKICYLVFHEMRHIYQIEAVNIYSLKLRMGGYSRIASLESDKKTAQWLQEMKKDCNIPFQDRDSEADANDFAYYLTNRFPQQMAMLKTSRRLGAMKRKYDKIPIPEV